MLDLVFLRLEVLNARGKLKEAVEEGKGEFLGAFAMSVGALLPGESFRNHTVGRVLKRGTQSVYLASGFRHVPLYDSIGDQHLFSTLFIKSRIVPTHEAG